MDRVDKLTIFSQTFAMNKHRETVIELYQQGLSYNQITAKLGVSKSTISGWCSDLAQTRLAVVKPRKEKLPVIRKRVLADAPYQGYFLYSSMGKDGVSRIHLHGDGQKLGMSKARYMMSVHLNRVLRREEVVKHIDNVTGNDVLDNLEIRIRGQRIPPIKQCVICEEDFHPKKATVETCSKACKSILVSGVMRDRYA